MAENDEVPPKKVKSTKEPGTLLFSGTTDYSKRNERAASTRTDIKFAPTRFETLEGVRIVDVSSHPLAYFTIALSEDGKLYSWGDNSFGQLGLGDFRKRCKPTVVKAMSNYNIVHMATGRQHCLLVTDEGEVFACGKNAMGQCGIGKGKESACKPTKINLDAHIKSVACGDDFSLLLSDTGVLYSVGSSENGYLGNGVEERDIGYGQENFIPQWTPIEVTQFIENDDGEIIPHGQPVITQIAAGSQHACAIDDLQRIFTWGFGGYGRLGHSSTQNELRPRLMNRWYKVTGRADGGVTRVWCGAEFTIVDTIRDKAKLMFGQFKKSGEVNMYPKFMDDLMGWRVRDVACGILGFMICADDSVIGMQCQGDGKLAMGDKQKSSAKPILITTLDDVYCLRVGLGYQHSCFIVRDTTDKDKKAIEKFSIITDEESEEFEGVGGDDDEEEEEEEVPSKKAKGNKGKAKPKGKKKL